jgi:hypothetical protein
MMRHPLLRLMPKQDRRLRSGYPWAFSNEIAMSPEHRTWSPGLVVRLESHDEWRHGAFMLNRADQGCHPASAERWSQPPGHRRSAGRKRCAGDKGRLRRHPP